MISWLVPFALAAAASPQFPAAEEISASGPYGVLKGTYQPAAAQAPVVLIIPGSGPTDRDGNNRLGVRAAPYRLLAEALAGRGIASVRIDKRGMFGSAAAVPDPNAVTIDDYATDTAAWVAAIRQRTGARCVWLVGHSEGALVALVSATRSNAAICGVVLISAPGRPLGQVVMAQLRTNPANAPLLPAAERAVASLAAGRRVNPATIPAALLPLFAPPVQGFLISVMALDPARLAAQVKQPVLVVQGDEDLQTGAEDAARLTAAAPGAKLASLAGINHVLKRVPASDPAANLAAYGDPALPIAPRVVEAVVDFVKGTASRGRR